MPTLGDSRVTSGERVRVGVRASVQWLLKRLTMLLAVSAALALSGCGRLNFQRVPRTDAGTDASGDAAADARSSDGGRDAQTTSDASTDASTDATAEAGTDASTDATAEAGTDAAMDAAFDAGFDAGPPRDLDYCTEVPPLRGPVTIDGVLEPGLLLRALDPVGWTSGQSIPTGESSSYAVAWQPDGLYFYVAVTDSSRIPAAIDDAVWIGDGVELYADADGVFSAPPAYDNPGTTQLVAAAPGDDTTSVARGERYRDMGSLNAWTSSTYRAFPTPTGYVVEALVQAADLDLQTLQLSTGARVGVNLSVNVSVELAAFEPDGGAVFPRLGQYFLRTSAEPHVCGGAPFCQPLAFCTPLLID